MEVEEKEMLENVEHCIKNFNGRMIDCIAVGDMYKKYVEQKAELKKYKNMYKAEHEIHLVRNEQLERKERGIQQAKEIEYENIGLKNDLETYKKIAEKLALTILEESDVYEIICKNIDRNKCDEYGDGNCIQCIIDCARKEAEKDEK